MSYKEEKLQKDITMYKAIIKSRFYRNHTIKDPNWFNLEL